MRSKIKFNHLIFTKMSKSAFTILFKMYGSLIFRNQGEMLYTHKAPITKYFYIVLYGGFNLHANDGTAFG